VDEGSRGAKAVRALRDAPERFLATVQIGITVVSASAAAFGGASLAEPLAGALEGLGLPGPTARPVAFGAVVGAISFLSLVLGELVPKSLALRYSERYALSVARPMRRLSWLLRPVAWVLTASSNLVLRLFGDKTNFTEARVSPEELQQMVQEAARSGSVPQQMGDIASRAFDLAEVRLAQVMVPRARMVTLQRGASAADLRAAITAGSGHSRLPVYEGRLDNIIGYVLAKDLLARVLAGPYRGLDDALLPPLFLPETARAHDALRLMQQRRASLAIVVDEHGSVAGLVTFEDVVEELVGDIKSEHEAPSTLVRRQPDGTAVVQAHASLREVNRVLELELPEGDGWSTLSGLVGALAGRIPGKGEKVTTPSGAVLEVLEASDRRVNCVKIHPPPKAEAREEGEEGEESAGPPAEPPSVH
jgi:putative hemolysin